MGLGFMDQYSLLHFAVGVIFYFWGFSLFYGTLIHVLFEYLENTTRGMAFINDYLGWWPGGKPYADSVLNSFGDSVFFVIGFLVAKYLDKYGTKYGWYTPHLETR
jgi:hypothetical protein